MAAKRLKAPTPSTTDDGATGGLALALKHTMHGEHGEQWLTDTFAIWSMLGEGAALHSEIPQRRVNRW